MNDTKIYTPGLNREMKAELWAAYAKLGRLISRLGAAEEESEPQVFIYGAPDHDPIMASTDDFKPFDDAARVCYVQNADTGLIVAFHEEDAIVLKNHLCVVGPFAMYRYGEHGERCSVTVPDYEKALEQYFRGLDALRIGAVKVPAVWFRAKGGAYG